MKSVVCSVFPHNLTFQGMKVKKSCFVPQVWDSCWSPAFSLATRNYPWGESPSHRCCCSKKKKIKSLLWKSLKKLTFLTYLREFKITQNGLYSSYACQHNRLKSTIIKKLVWLTYHFLIFSLKDTFYKWTNEHDS